MTDAGDTRPPCRWGTPDLMLVHHAVETLSIATPLEIQTMHLADPELSDTRRLFEVNNGL